MSKGCLIALIIVGVLLLLVIIAGVTCYMKRADLAKYATVTLLDEVKKISVSTPQDGVDTTVLNTIVDNFNERLQTDEQVDLEKIGQLMQSLQAIPSDEKVDSAEAQQLMNSLIDFYPDLEELIIPPSVDTTEMLEDSLITGN
jgi:hypothetical protein